MKRLSPLLSLFLLAACDHHPATVISPPTSQSATELPAAANNLPPRILVTKSYIVTIVDDRVEGNVTWDHVIYTGANRETGQSITLIGSDLHHLTPDGTPGAFLGYAFQNGNITYQVLEQGRLTVIQGTSKVLVDEPGHWQPDSIIQ